MLVKAKKQHKHIVQKNYNKKFACKRDEYENKYEFP